MKKRKCNYPKPTDHYCDETPKGDVCHCKACVFNDDFPCPGMG